MAPSTASISSGLLQISGRPANQVTNNLCTLGRVVALAHSLGLHRSPVKWKILEAEKALRIKLWWAVLIHDCWSSYAHGTPPTIRTEYHDVPLPVDDLHSGNHPSSFYPLCSLTQILAETLPIVYTLKDNDHDMWREVRAIEHRLDDWELHLRADFRLGGRNRACEEIINGSSSLHFCFLAVKMLVCRVALQVCTCPGHVSNDQADVYRLQQEVLPVQYPRPYRTARSFFERRQRQSHYILPVLHSST